MSERDMNKIDKIVERGEVTMSGVRMERPQFLGHQRSLILDDMTIRLASESFSDQVRISLVNAPDLLDVEEAKTLDTLLSVARSIITLYDVEMKTERAEREAKRKRERDEYLAETKRKREEALKAREERERLTAERTERLLMEFVGDEVRLRHKGYKSLARATVEAQETVDPDKPYRPFFRWVNWNVDCNRPQNVQGIRRLDVREGSRFYTVWDDGPDDLPAWERASGAPSRPWRGGIR